MANSAEVEFRALQRQRVAFEVGGGSRFEEFAAILEAPSPPAEMLSLNDALSRLMLF